MLQSVTIPTYHTIIILTRADLWWASVSPILRHIGGTTQPSHIFGLKTEKK